MIYLTKEDWNNLILSKLSEQASFNEQFLELVKIHKTFHFFTTKMYQPNEENKSLINMVFIGGMTLFHKYRICSDFSLNKYSSEETYILIGACLFIGQKAINVLKARLIDVSKFIEKLILSKEPTKKVNIKKLKEKIKNKELEILTTLGFNIDVDLPISFIKDIKKKLSENKLNLNIDNTLTLLNIFIEDSLILPLSIYYTPNIITISCVLALKQRYNLTNINIKELIALSEYDLDKQEIQDCFALINKIIIAKSDFIKNQKNKAKLASNAKTEDKNTMNSDKASITKIIPSINMNVN
jgi:hypothetical protein